MCAACVMITHPVMEHFGMRKIVRSRMSKHGKARPMKTTLIATFAASAALIALPALADGKNDGQIDQPFVSDSAPADQGVLQTLKAMVERDAEDRGLEDASGASPELESESEVDATVTGTDPKGD